ncbi:MAG: ABC transporter substrate-binding protein [Oscillospiraceae bacterium]|nr:ABC transporter substrate-binding protein [Oscillospiraceae bacterium]
MKKLFAILLSIVLIVSCFAACAQETKPEPVPTETDTSSQETVPVETQETALPSEATEETEPAPEVVRVGTLMGPTGMGMAKLMDDAANGTAAGNYDFFVASAPDQIAGEVISGNLDIAAVPVNLASVLWQKTDGNVQVIGVNTLGVLYILENGDTIHSVSDLAGKTLYATGQGATPEYILNYLLAANGLDPETDLTIEYLSEHTELATKLSAGEVVLGMLPEPNVTAALSGNPDLRIALDLTEEWDKVSDSVLVQGCVIVSRAFAEQYPQAVETFLEEYRASVDFVNANPEDASAMIEAAGIVPKAAVALKALPNCNICLLTGEEMKTAVEQMLNVLYGANPKSVGGALPDAEFYR